MSFTVEPSPSVLRAVSACTPSQQDFFWRQVCAVLAENPYEFRDVIQRNVDSTRRVFYQYYDGIIPLVFTYRVFPPAEEWQEGAPRLRAYHTRRSAVVVVLLARLEEALL